MDKKQDKFYLSSGNSKTKKQKDDGNLDKDDSGGIEEKSKKPFDKKAYRLKKYSKKYKLEQWEQQRRKKVLHDYYKETKNDPLAGTYKPKGFDDSDDEVDANAGKFVRHPDACKVEVKTFKEKDPFKKAKERYNSLKQQKLEKQKEIERKKEIKMQKLQEYKKKKAERFKKLSQKTKKGQPVMTGRLEMLLEKIQKK